MTTLLELAVTHLAARTPHSNRIAGWFARAALEETIDNLLHARNIDPGRASARARLCFLEVAYRDVPEVAAEAGYAWDRLSQACHQHAYQLSPTYSEVAHLLATVSTLDDRFRSEQRPG
ncbi:hypothetical protein [Nocardia flavorosea]|uniref:Uncharacterized protein n=1 Tax=Nocardia flavorosea TaxID=53429 RepID=A0A846YPB1_9NOCA|nr:hypothetical protein [Nocardia flavorosea]NKY59158.1 hypothetical protein [Nocardia flavorosea]